MVSRTLCRQEQELYRMIAGDNLFACIPGHVYWKNKDGIFLGCNGEQAKYFGFKDPTDIVGKTNFDLVDKDSAERITEIDKKVMDTGEVHVVEEVLYGSKWFLSKKLPLRDYKGEIMGVFGLSLEITEQKKLEECLKKQAQELAVALESREKFIRNVSHEMRTPLQIMMTVTEELLIQYDRLDDDRKKDFLGMVVDSNKRLVGLLSNLLDLSKFKEGKFVMEFKKSNIKEAIKNIINEFRYKHGAISLNVSNDVPEELVFDNFRVAQVVRNLIGNSIKYGGLDRPIIVDLSTCKERDKTFVKCSIKDDGVGVPCNEKEHIFDLFVESSKTRNLKGGTGLGLSIAKEIIESHKGRIWVDDLQAGETGSRFSFTLDTSLAESVEILT